MILVSLWHPRGFANFPKKTNFLIEVFPFRGLLIVEGSIASKSLDRCLQCRKVNGAPVSDALELMGGAFGSCSMDAGRSKIPGVVQKRRSKTMGTRARAGAGCDLPFTFFVSEAS